MQMKLIFSESNTLEGENLCNYSLIILIKVKITLYNILNKYYNQLVKLRLNN